MEQSSNITWMKLVESSIQIAEVYRLKLTIMFVVNTI